MTTAPRPGLGIALQMITTHMLLSPCQVDILGHQNPVTINITPSTRMEDIKKQLAAATGIPAKDQKLLLSGIDRLTMGSRKTNLRFGSCGTADSISFAVKTK